MVWINPMMSLVSKLAIFVFDKHWSIFFFVNLYTELVSSLHENLSVRKQYSDCEK